MGGGGQAGVDELLALDELAEAIEGITDSGWNEHTFHLTRRFR